MRKAHKGDVIRVNRGAYAHYGIYVETEDGGHVIHYTGDNSHSDFKGVVRETSVKEFLDGSDKFYVCSFDPEEYPEIYSGEETVARARSKIGEKSYNLFSHNCEHFAVECKTGQEKSSQTEILDIASIPSKILSSIENLFSF